MATRQLALCIGGALVILLGIGIGRQRGSPDHDETVDMDSVARGLARGEAAPGVEPPAPRKGV